MHQKRLAEHVKCLLLTSMWKLQTKVVRIMTLQLRSIDFVVDIHHGQHQGGLLNYELRVTSYELRVSFNVRVTSYELLLFYELLFILRVTSYKLFLFYELLFILRVTSYELLLFYELLFILRVTSYKLF